MKQLILSFAIVFLFAGGSDAQPVANIFNSTDFAAEIKKPEKLEIVKDVFQGAWAINVYSADGAIVDTVLVKLQNYSTKHRNVVLFSSAMSDSFSNAVDPSKVTFFQSQEKSTIRFALDNAKTLNFDGVLKDDLTISAVSADANGQTGEFKIVAVKLGADFGSTYVCGNDDGKKEGEPLHGRHFAKSPQLKSLEQDRGCKDWKVYKEPDQ